MSVDHTTVKRIAHLARLKLADEDVAPLAGEMNTILGFVEQLGEVNTDNVQPMTSVVDMQMRWREDKVTDGGIQDKVLKNAPQAEHGFYAVPKVVE